MGWNIFSSSKRKNDCVEKEIISAYLTQPNVTFFSKCMYEEYRDYAILKDGTENRWDDGFRSISCDLIVNGEEISAVITENRANHRANVKVVNSAIEQEKFAAEMSEKIGFDFSQYIKK